MNNNIDLKIDLAHKPIGVVMTIVLYVDDTNRLQGELHGHDNEAPPVDTADAIALVRKMLNDLEAMTKARVGK